MRKSEIANLDNFDTLVSEIDPLIQQNPDRTGQLGGYTQNAGKKNRSGKLTARDLLETAEQVIGKPLAVSIMEGYRESILNGDTKLRVIYEKMLLDKTATTLYEVDVEHTEDQVKLRAQNFQDAIASLVNLQLDHSKPKDTKHAIN